jgi:hypothetical protein
LGFSFCGLALVVPVYTPGVLGGALLFIKSSYLSKKILELFFIQIALKN